MSNDSLSISSGALNAYQDEINLVSNNLANAGTIGFKDQNMTFEDQYNQILANPTGLSQSRGGTNPDEIGSGVRVASTSTDFSQGSLESTGVNTDLAINGNGFFILGTLNNSSSPLFTRNGSFNLNQAGTLIDPTSGLAVLGYAANSLGQLPSAGYGVAPSAINLPVGLSTSAVGTGFGTKIGPSSNDQVFDLTQGGNLNATSWQNVANGSTAVTQTTTTTIYDSLGNGHQLTLVYTPVSPVAGLPTSVDTAAGVAEIPSTAWQVSAYFGDGTKVNNAAATSSSPASIGYVYFDQNGQYINSSSGDTTATVTASTVHTAGDPPSAATGNLLNVTAWGSGDNALPTSAASIAAIGIGYNNLSSLAGTGQPLSTITQNGYAQGTMTGFTVGADGTITGNFSNGQQKTLAQVAIATFENEQGLEQAGNSKYVQTVASGLPQIGTPSSGTFGSIVGDSLEQSNVSIATEFTKLIVAQNAYLSNSKAITIANQDLQAVDQLIA